VAKQSKASLVAVVDDDPSVRESLEPLLESAGYRARSFATAEAFLEAGILDLACLISDIDLPGIDGFELLRLVQASAPALPVILITGHHEIQYASPRLGMRYFRLFRKPFDPDELLDAVADAMQGSNGAAAP
jgi:FixJ family two-component response regulator